MEEEKIYDSVENVREEVKKLKQAQENFEAEDEDWDSLPLPLAEDQSPLKNTKAEFDKPKAKFEESDQPLSLELKSENKRRGSRKSRSLRSTHLAMMSQQLVINQEKGSLTSSDSGDY